MRILVTDEDCKACKGTGGVPEPRVDVNTRVLCHCVRSIELPQRLWELARLTYAVPAIEETKQRVHSTAQAAFFIAALITLPCLALLSVPKDLLFMAIFVLGVFTLMNPRRTSLRFKEKHPGV